MPRNGPQYSPINGAGNGRRKEMIEKKEYPLPCPTDPLCCGQKPCKNDSETCGNHRRSMPCRGYWRFGSEKFFTNEFKSTKVVQDYEQRIINRHIKLNIKKLVDESFSFKCILHVKGTKAYRFRLGIAVFALKHILNLLCSNVIIKVEDD